VKGRSQRREGSEEIEKGKEKDEEERATSKGAAGC